LIKVDTKTITDKSNVATEYNFLVIGDPCAGSPPRCTTKGEFDGCLPMEAPDVVCSGATLTNATRSDGGHVIIGLLRDTGDFQEGEFVDYATEKDASGGTLKGACDTREQAGFNSGMGAIFQQVARINPIR
jgi:hypothetical protein